MQSVVAHPGDCTLTTGTCSQLVTYTQTTPGQQPLTTVRYRFLDPSESLTQVTDGSGNPLAATVGSTPIAGHVEFDIAAPPALLQPGGTATNQIAVGFNAPFQPVCPTPALGSCYDNVPPFSVEFDFANGVTSRAGFDSVTGTFTSEAGQDVGFDPTNSNLTIGPSILPQENVPTDLEYQTTTPEILESIVPPLEFPSADTSVPEPATWGALGLGALATAFSSRSRRKFATR